MISRAARREPGAFGGGEFERRIENARREMTRAKLDALLVTAEANIEYLSGFTTQFAWNTPTRPWYFLVPRRGEAIGIIPEIGISNWLATSWCKALRSWPSPRPQDEGLDLLTQAIGEVARRYGRIGVELGAESRLGMPVADLLRLRDLVRPFELVDGFGVTRALRLVKSPAEIRRIRHICQIAGDSFDALPGTLTVGDSEKDIVRRFQADLLLRGADKTPYAAIGTGPGGYDSIIMGPSDRRLAKGDILIIDTGARCGGYFCDFDRNIAIGPPSDDARRVHAALYRATSAGIKAARPGATAAKVFKAQAEVLSAAGFDAGNVGRMGHGLGKVLTEPPSIKGDDRTKLVPGMVLTIEPSASYGRGRIMAHEENIVVTETGSRLLTRRAQREMPVVAI